jgi:energy-coupling factor transport system ATP-binding protein
MMQESTDKQTSPQTASEDNGARNTDAIAISGLWWRYPTFSEKPNAWTLRDISLHVRPGECFGITGPSGAGKTTLCRALLGIIPHNSHLNEEQLPHHFRGNISILGQPVTMQTAREQKIGMVLQDPENQFLRMSLLHELGLGMQLQGMANEEILQRSYEALRWVGLEHLWQGAAYVHPSDLSGGQKQRVAIAAFLALRPDVLVLDEPTSDLDPVGKREVIETIARLRRDYKMTVILVEQDPEILATFCDRIALVHEGRVELVSPTDQFYRQRALLERYGASLPL